MDTDSGHPQCVVTGTTWRCGCCGEGALRRRQVETALSASITRTRTASGTMGKVKTQQGPDSDAVRLELQADCYAGMWARAATTTEDEDGNVLITQLTQDDIQQAIEAAEAVGDDRIQQRSGGSVDPDSFTHGSAEQRVKWFRIGYENRSLRDCDTFAASSL